MEKRRIVVNYSAVPREVLMKIKSDYPNGITSGLIKFPSKEDQAQEALLVDMGDVLYLVKVPKGGDPDLSNIDEIDFSSEDLA